MNREDSFLKRKAELSTSRLALLEKRLHPGSRQGISDIICQRPQQEMAPLSFAQQRLWFLQQLEPESAAYNEPIVVRLNGPLDLEAFTRMAREITRRHTVLGSKFTQVDRQLVQVHDPHAYKQMQVPVTDLSGVPDAQREGAVQYAIQQELQRPFALAQDLPWRTSLLRLNEQEHISVTILHHTVTDAWSLSIFYREVGQLYHAFCQHQPSPLPVLPLQYADYAYWQRQRLADGSLDHHLDYWRQQLAAPLPVLDVPTDYPRPAMQTYRGSRVSMTIPVILTQQLHALCRQEDVTLFMTLLAAFQILLYRYTQQEDVIVGTPIAGRTHQELEVLLGCFVNTLALRTNLAGSPSFREVLQRVRKVTLEAYDHQEIPFEKLVEELQPERSLSRNPLFQSMFVLQNAPVTTMEFDNLTLQRVDVEHSTAKFDVELVLEETESGLHGYLEYNTDLFEPDTMQRLSAHYQNVLEAMLAHPEQPVDTFPLLSHEEWQQQVITWNATSASPQHTSFYERFVEQAQKTPQALAVVDTQQHLTYQQLLEQSTRLATSLQQAGVGPETLVALLLERNCSFLTAMLAVFQTGAAYLPLDPASPPARLHHILAQSGAHVLLTNTASMASLPPVPDELPLHILNLDMLPTTDAPFVPVPYQEEHLAYVIYTSGSTGTPKGAMIEQRGMLNHLSAKIDALQLTADDCVAQTASQCFDISVWQFLAVLLVGGCVRIYPDAITHDPVQLLAAVAQDHVSILETVPSLLRAMLDSQESQHTSPLALSALRWLIPTGEALPGDLARRWLQLYPNIPLLNAYGPTECSDDVTHHILNASTSPVTGIVPIGHPLANTQLYILDRHLLPVPIGVSGELYVGGRGVGRGYRADPGRTAAVFLPDPFSSTPGGRLYKTGDLARYRADGTIEFLGRTDSQVKLRGYRIELPEIEAVLNRHPLVRESVVLLHEEPSGNQSLTAYIVPLQEDVISARQVQSLLREQLPAYMIPAAIVFLPAFPLTANGKLDRTALFSLKEKNAQLMVDEYIAPRTLSEKQLARIWQEVLALPRVGIHENFFEIGGHSLIVMRVLARVKDTFNVDLPVRTLFQTATIAELAEVIDLERIRSNHNGNGVSRQAPVSISRAAYRQKRSALAASGQSLT